MRRPVLSLAVVFFSRACRPRQATLKHRFYVSGFVPRRSSRTGNDVLVANLEQGLGLQDRRLPRRHTGEFLLAWARFDGSAGGLLFERTSVYRSLTHSNGAGSNGIPRVWSHSLPRSGFSHWVAGRPLSRTSAPASASSHGATARPASSWTSTASSSATPSRAVAQRRGLLSWEVWVFPWARGPSGLKGATSGRRAICLPTRTFGETRSIWAGSRIWRRSRCGSKESENLELKTQKDCEDRNMLESFELLSSEF